VPLAGAAPSFVGELIDMLQKFRIGQDVVNNEASQKRIRALMRERILDDEEFIKVASSFAESSTNFSAIRTRRFWSRSRWIARFLRRVFPATHWKSTSSVARLRRRSMPAWRPPKRMWRGFVANTVISDVLTRITKELGKGVGVVPEDDNSVESQAIGLVLELIIGAAIDRATDPTDEIVRKLSDRLAAAESAILDGTVQKPGLFRSLRQLTAERTAARRAVLGAHFGK
jgi:hypothetical protein